MAAPLGHPLSLEEYLALPEQRGLEEVIDGRAQARPTPSHYRDIALAEGGEPLRIDRPFPVSFRPADLVPRPP